jgi:hypothetical protein
MPRRRANPSQSQSNDHDLVPYTKYRPKRRSLPPEYNEIRASPAFEPLQLDPIMNSGPNLSTNIDFDEPVAFFRLFFTDEVIHASDDTWYRGQDRDR